jgi:predicted ATP-binding protein involved in virulence
MANKRYLRIFLSHAAEDRNKVDHLYKQLLDEGYSPWTADKNLLPGQAWDLEIQKAIRECDVFLACISQNSISRKGYYQRELKLALDFLDEKPADRIFLIPVLLEQCQIPDELRTIQAVSLFESGGADRLLISLRKVATRLAREIPQKERKSFYIKKIELKNIRCFENFSLDLNDLQPILWTMILGDNAAGKSTLLRSIALGLCNEGDATSLVKYLKGGFLRDGAKEGYIRLTLINQNRPNATYTITTRLFKDSKGQTEKIRQDCNPSNAFPWSDIFVCGYGTNRSTQDYTSHETYTVASAVKSLFSYETPLQNPEVVLLRQDRDIRQKLERIVLNILMLDEPTNEFAATQNGIGVFGPWGFFPITALSDGYRSTIQWVLDFLSWQIYANRLVDITDIGGILLVDEIEQHLHPRWQRYIVQRLRRQFPKTQIIASTHTPLTAAGLADIDQSLLLKLEMDVNGKIAQKTIEKDAISGKRADQILASDAFDLLTTRSPGSEDDIDHYTELLSKSKRSRKEEAEFEELRNRLQKSLSTGENESQQLFENEITQFLLEKFKHMSPNILDAQVKKQIREIFKGEKSEKN